MEKKSTCEDVARRAYDLFLSRGGEHCRDFDDWLYAERELTATASAPLAATSTDGRLPKTAASRKTKIRKSGQM